MPAYSKHTELKEKRSTIRAWMVGFVLIPVNCYWIIQMEEVRLAPATTIFSLFFNAVFTLWMLFLFNLGLRRFVPKIAFDNRELLTIYIMVNMSTAICSFAGMLPILLSVITYAHWGATPENEWRELFHRDLPQSLIISDWSALTEFYRGEASLYTTKNAVVWVPPLLWWSFFTFVLIFVMLCINIIVRRQWIEHEKLAYPVAEIPLTLVHSRGYTRLLWIGFAIAGAINLINGLHFLYPSVPGFLTVFKRHRIGYIFTEKPWSAWWATRVSFMPSIIGLSFFMPLDVLFSSWFFYLYWQGWRIVSTMAGWRNYPGYDRFVYIVQESVGAYFAILVIVIWRSRRHLLQTLQGAFGKSSVIDERGGGCRSYRMAWLGLIGGMVILAIFCYYAGMSMRIAILFVLFYFGVSTAVTRLRAEFGFPNHDVHYGGPVQMITSALGTTNLSQQTRVALPLFWYISRVWSSHIMPHQLEGFKIADRSRVSYKTVFWSMVLGCAFGIVVTFWLLLHVGYQMGVENITYPSWGREVWNYLQKWLRSPTQIDYHHISLMGLGVVVASFLAFMRARFVWWPLHPMGYAVAGSYGMSFVWSCILVSWIFKWLILRHGGIKRYRQAVPLFFGLILGEFTIAAIWAILGICLNWPRIYQFWITEP